MSYSMGVMRTTPHSVSEGVMATVSLDSYWSPENNASNAQFAFVFPQSQPALTVTLYFYVTSVTGSQTLRCTVYEATEDDGSFLTSATWVAQTDFLVSATGWNSVPVSLLPIVAGRRYIFVLSNQSIEPRANIVVVQTESVVSGISPFGSQLALAKMSSGLMIGNPWVANVSRVIAGKHLGLRARFSEDVNVMGVSTRDRFGATQAQTDYLKVFEDEVLIAAQTVDLSGFYWQNGVLLNEPLLMSKGKTYDIVWEIAASASDKAYPCMGSSVGVAPAAIKAAMTKVNAVQWAWSEKTIAAGSFTVIDDLLSPVQLMLVDNVAKTTKIFQTSDIGTQS